jgi:division protein CdvB (Snf7/Vps24/ESCRT-III family)
MFLVKKIVYLLLLFVFSLSLVGCKKEKELGTPINVKLQGETVSWDAVENADGYVVKVGIAEHTAASTTFDLGTLTLAEGTYQVSVKATSTDELFLDSKYSTAVSYVVGPASTTLSAPALSITGGVASWNAVEHASGYVLKVGTTEYTLQAGPYDLAGNLSGLGEYAVSVKAVGNGTAYLDSAFSSVLTYNLTQEVVTEKRTAVLEQFLAQFDYSLEMDESDFTDPMDYYDYISMVESAEGVLDTVLDAGVVFSQINQGYELFANIDYTQAPTPELLEQLVTDFEAIGITAEQYATILLGYLNLQLTAQIAMMEQTLAYYEESVAADLEQVTTSTSNLETAQTALDTYFNGVTDEIILGFKSIIDDYYDCLFSSYESLEYKNSIDFQALVSLIDDAALISAQYDAEVAKGESGSVEEINSLAAQLDQANLDIDNQLYWFYGADYEIVSSMREPLFNLSKAMFAYYGANVASYATVFSTVNTYYTAVKDARYSLIDANITYEENLFVLNSTQTQLAQLTLASVLMTDENYKLLFAASIENMFNVLNEVDWELMFSFVAAASDPMLLTPEVIASMVQEFVRLATLSEENTDYEEMADLVLPLLGALNLQLTEEQSQAVEQLITTILPAIDTHVLEVIGNFDQAVIEKILLLTALNPEDLSTVNPETTVVVEGNPELMIIVAQIYEAVLTDEILDIVAEVEKIYDTSVLFDPDLPVINFDDIVLQITTFNANVAEIAVYTVGEDGYYTDEQLTKIVEIMTYIENMVNQIPELPLL